MLNLTSSAKALSLCLFLLEYVFPINSFVSLQLHSGTSSLISAVSTRLRPDFCAQNAGHSKLQRKWCEEHRDLMPAVIKGSQLASEECARRMANRRWNCPIRKPQFIAAIQRRVTRERAFLNAIQSAGITLALARSCSRGLAQKFCTCGNGGDLARAQERVVNWTWGGCSDNFLKGQELSKNFLDNVRRKGRRSRQMAAHNFEVGRRVVHESMVLICKCHGLSGSCVSQACWYEVSKIQPIGATLRERFDDAFFLSSSSHRGKEPALAQSAPDADIDIRPQGPAREPSASDLVYFEQSPDYCTRNVKKGSPGTKGRRCEKDSLTSASCNNLCCGRGFAPHRRIYEKRCQCQFVWCCRVECKTCREIDEYYTCQ